MVVFCVFLGYFYIEFSRLFKIGIWKLCNVLFGIDRNMDNEFVDYNYLIMCKRLLCGVFDLENY